MSNRNRKIKKAANATAETRLKRLELATAIISLLNTLFNLIEKIIDKLK